MVDSRTRSAQIKPRDLQIQRNGIITNTELSYTGHPCGALAIQADMPFCRVANVGDLHRSETHSGRRLAEQIGAGPNDRAMVVLYDSIRRTPAPGIPPVLNSSAPFIEGIESSRISTWACW